MKSAWIKNRKLPIYKLNKDIECEILIVGAGISGLLCAYELKKYSDSIVIIESDMIGCGASGRSTGKLSSQHGLNLQEIYKYHGLEKTKLYYEENQRAIFKIKEIIDEYNIECDYQDKNSIVGCKSKKEIERINREIEIYKLCNIDYEIIQNDEILLGVKFKNQASFDPYQFCIQLAEKLEIPIYEQTPLTHIHDHFVTSKNFHIKYKYCILATQVLPFQFKFFYAISKPRSSFLASLTPSNKSKDMILLEDRITKTSNELNDFMLIGGYDHALNEDIQYSWQHFKRNLVLEYPKYKIENCWSSQDYQVFDYLPIVDIVEDFIVITGFNKWGNTNAYVSSLIVAELILNKNTKRRDLFKLKRSTILLNTSIFSENIEVLKTLLLSKKKHGKLSIPNEDESITFDYESHPYGVYRSNEVLYIVDLVCPHLGCTLKWNQYEKSWDCPCHGSRFNINGEIIKGPTLINLHHGKCKLQ